MANEIVEIPEKLSFEERFRLKLAEYSKAFRIEDLNDANDRSTLEIMLRTELMIEDLQEQIRDLMGDNIVDNASNIKKLADLLRDSTTTITNLQKTLSIDRKTRKTEETASVADYIRALKRDAKEFMDQRIVRVYCPDCKIMVGRIYPVHDHTAFLCSFQCSQCNRPVRARREERDILFDIKDSAWRRKYKPEIIQPKKFAELEAGEHEDDLIINADPSVETTDLVEQVPVAQLEDQHIIGEE